MDDDGNDDQEEDEDSMVDGSGVTNSLDASPSSPVKRLSFGGESLQSANVVLTVEQPPVAMHVQASLPNQTSNMSIVMISCACASVCGQLQAEVRVLTQESLDRRSKRCRCLHVDSLC